MIRIVVFIVVIVIGLAWVAGHPGTVNVDWLGYQIKTSAFFAAIVLLAIFGLLLAAWSLLGFVSRKPKDPRR